MRHLFIALRTVDDLEKVSAYLNRVKAEGVERLSIAYLKFSQDSLGKIAVKLDGPFVTRGDCVRSLRGFDLELIEIGYSGDGLPASAYSDEAIRRHCDAILVVGAPRKLYSSTSLASSLVDESTIPVIVIKP